MENDPEHLSQEQQERFERFLMDRMDPAERARFLKALDSDTDLALRFDDFKTLFRAVEEDALRNNLEDIHDQVTRTPTRIQRPKFNYMRMAATVAVLIALGIFFLNRKSANERLYDTYFTPDPGLPTVMGTTDNFAFYDAMVNYKQGQYKTAIGKWEKLLATKPRNDTLNYFLGSAYMADGETPKAIPFFEHALQTTNSVFTNDILYYLAMAKLKQNDRSGALEHLMECASENCRELISEIEK